MQRKILSKDERKIYSDIIKYYSDNKKFISNENLKAYIFRFS